MKYKVYLNGDQIAPCGATGYTKEINHLNPIDKLWSLEDYRIMHGHHRHAPMIVQSIPDSEMKPILLKHFRELKDLSIREACKIAEVSFSSWKKWERGENSMGLATLLGCLILIGVEMEQIKFIREHYNG